MLGEFVFFFAFTFLECLYSFVCMYVCMYTIFSCLRNVEPLECWSDELFVMNFFHSIHKFNC